MTFSCNLLWHYVLVCIRVQEASTRLKFKEPLKTKVIINDERSKCVVALSWFGGFK